MYKKFKPIIVFAVAIVCVVAMAVTSSYAQAIVYGTSLGSGEGDIYKIDLAAGTATWVFSTGLDPANSSWPNSNAFDAVNNHLYYSTSSNPAKLYFYDFDSKTQNLAGTLVGIIAGASFYDGKYYYIRNDTDDLYAVSLNADGTVASVDKKADFTSGAKLFYFGDIVITSEGVLYGSAGVRGVSSHEFFKIDLNNSYNYTDIADSHPALQLAIGSDGTLYGHYAGDGEFYTVNPTDGIRTSIGFVTGSVTGKFTDLASGGLCPPFVTDLWVGAGQNDITKGTNVGTVTVTNDSENLYVTYEITSTNCYMAEVHLYVGTEFPESAAPGMFPYKEEFIDNTTEWTFSIPLDDFDEECGDLVIAAHAEVCCGDPFLECETAWGYGENALENLNITKKWGWYFLYAICCD